MRLLSAFSAAAALAAAAESGAPWSPADERRAYRPFKRSSNSPFSSQTSAHSSRRWALPAALLQTKTSYSSASYSKKEEEGEGASHVHGHPGTRGPAPPHVHVITAVVHPPPSSSSEGSGSGSADSHSHGAAWGRTYGGPVFHGSIGGVEEAEESHTHRTHAHHSEGDEKGGKTKKSKEGGMGIFAKLKRLLTRKNVGASVNKEEAIADFAETEQGSELLDCIRLSNRASAETEVDKICGGLKGHIKKACLKLKRSVLAVVMRLSTSCKQKPLHRCFEKELVFPLVHPLFTVFDEQSQLGIRAADYDWKSLEAAAASSSSKAGKLKEEEALFLEEAAGTFYGAAVDLRQDHFKKLLKKTRRFGFSKTKRRRTETAIREYKLCAFFSLARAPEVDSLFVKVFLDLLDFRSCPSESKVRIQAKKDKKPALYLPAKEVRERVLMQRVKRSLRFDLESGNPVAKYNFQLQKKYLTALPWFERLLQKVRGEAGEVPSPSDFEPSAQSMQQLLDLQREELASLALEYLGKKGKSLSKFKQFLIRHKLARKVYLGFLRFALRIALPLTMRLQARGSRSNSSYKRHMHSHQQQQQQRQWVTPDLGLEPGPMAWVEYVQVYSRELVFFLDKGQAELEAALVAAVLKAALKRQRKAEEDKEKKEKNKKKKREEKEQKERKRKEKEEKKEKKRKEKEKKKEKKKEKNQKQRGEQASLVQLRQKTSKNHTGSSFLQHQQEEGSLSPVSLQVLSAAAALHNSSSSRTIRVANSFLESEGEGVEETKGSTLNKIAIVLVVMAIFSILALAGGATMGIGVAAITIAVSVVGCVLIFVYKFLKMRSSRLEGGGGAGEEEGRSLFKDDAGEEGSGDEGGDEEFDD